MRDVQRRCEVTLKVLWCLVCPLLGPGSFSSSAAPTVIITNLPAYGSYQNLGGVVRDASPSANRIAVFIYVPGAGWWSKPTCPGQPLTVIQPDGSWSTDITTGGSDQMATRVAALLVGTNYNEGCLLGAAFIPTNVYARALHSAVVTRPAPGARWLSYSGYDWWVKSSTGKVGPGPNYFSDSTNNVWVDELGQLHLRITNRSNQWQCAEIVSARTFGYGQYRFELGPAADALDPNAVLGLFTWSDDPAFTYREMDVECSRWSNAADPNNTQYIVQPDANGHKVRFALPAGLTNSTHLFKWETNRVSYQSQRGSYVVNPLPGYTLNAWVYSLAVPQTGDENVRLNLWLNQGWAPARGQEVEVVVRSFDFVPLGIRGPASLTNVTRLASGEVQFAMQTEPDRRYEVQSSTNLLDWETVVRVLGVSTSILFTDTNAAPIERRFYRAVTCP